jgi:hypothetical protein
MKANSNCEGRYAIDVYLDGKQLDDCIQADEEAAEVIVCYRDVKGKLVPENFAERGSLICDGVQVLRLLGKVEIKVTPCEGVTEEELRKLIEDSYVPFDVEVIR